MVAALLATIALGLASRRWPLPGVLAEHAGDALYAVAVFQAAALFAPAARGGRLAAFAWIASALVEASQALQWPWLVDLRHTKPGALLLGQGYQTADLVAYAAGAAAAWLVDAGLRAASRARRGSAAPETPDSPRFR